MRDDADLSRVRQGRAAPQPATEAMSFWGTFFLGVIAFELMLIAAALMKIAYPDGIPLS